MTRERRTFLRDILVTGIGSTVVSAIFFPGLVLPGLVICLVLALMFATGLGAGRGMAFAGSALAVLLVAISAYAYGSLLGTVVLVAVMLLAAAALLFAFAPRDEPA